jgi:two-component system, LytTR family, sensor kinase
MSSDRRTPLFWLLQIGGWLAVGVLLVIVRAGVVPLEFMAGVKLVFSMLGFLLTLGLRAVYRRLLRRGAGLPTVIAASVAGAGIAAVLWTVPYNLFLAVAVRWYLGVPYPMGAARQVLDGAVQHTFMMLAWSVLYFGIRYYQRMQEAREVALLAEAELHRAELQALRYQLNPHFLFNTLNSVATLVYRNPEAAAQMLGRLTGFLRRTLEGDGAPLTTLDRELEFVKQYLSIEKTRFGDRLSLEIDADPAVRGAMVPTLILQPLVENAIHHAVAVREEGDGRILVRAQRGAADTLHIAIIDNGAGVSAGSREGGHGIGLANMRRRLQQIYGDAGRFELRFTPGGGATAIIELPLASSTGDATDAA